METFLNSRTPRLKARINYCPQHSSQNRKEWKRWRAGLEDLFAQFTREDWKSRVVDNARAVMTDARLPQGPISRRLGELPEVDFGHGPMALLFAYKQCLEQTARIEP